MAPKRIDAEVLPRPIKNVHHITAAHNQRLTQIRESLLEIKQRLATKQPLPFRRIGLLP
jgi:predicted small metal-binding protein